MYGSPFAQALWELRVRRRILQVESDAQNGVEEYVARLQKPAGCTRSETARAGEQMGKVESRAMEIGRPGTTRMLRRSGRASSFLPPTHQLAGRRSGQAILTDNCQSIMLRQDPCLFLYAERRDTHRSPVTSTAYCAFLRGPDIDDGAQCARQCDSGRNAMAMLAVILDASVQGQT
jgi:hypothetical protein